MFGFRLLNVFGIVWYGVGHIHTIERLLGGFHLLAHGGGGLAKLQGGYVVLERYLGGLSHIEKPFEGGFFETLHQLNPTSLY